MRPVRLSRDEQRALTRERLLAAAEDVFSRLGYGGASVDLIAAEAGYSKGAIYSNFPNKEAIFLELLRMYMERDMAALEAIVKAGPDKLIGAVTGWLKAMHAQGDCTMLVTELQLHARRSPEFASQYYALQRKQTRALAKALEVYVEASGVQIPIDLVDLAASLTALARGLSLQRPAEAPGSISNAGRVIDSLLKALAAGRDTQKVR